MSAGRDDIIRDVLERCMVAYPGFSDAVAADIERAVRRDWAGDRPYIHGPDDFARRKAAAAQDLQRGARPAEVAKAHGISRRCIYNLLKKQCT